jgi:hypothetical protein
MLDSRLLSRRWKAHTAWVFHFVRSLRTRQRSILRPLAALLVITSFFAAHAADNPPWLVQTRANYTLHYSAADQTQVAEYESFLAKGIAANEAFFGSTYPKQFDIYIYQDRASLDTDLQKVIHEPNYKSPCWLQAIGDSEGVHLLSPLRWDVETCEGRYTTYADKQKTQKLITHELTHVFHGQTIRDHSPDRMKDISWFEEGLAVYVAGQLGPFEIHDVQAALQAHNVPGGLHGIATSDSILLRYSMMGSLAMYIDRTYGRAKLKGLLQLDSQKEILSSLGVTELQFMDGWKHFMLNSAGMSR